MAIFEHPYIHEVAALGLPQPERIMITHGSALVVRGVRPEHTGGDIDLIGSQENLRYLEHELGWVAVREGGMTHGAAGHKLLSTASPNGRFDVFSYDIIPVISRQPDKQIGHVYPDELFARHDAQLDQDERTGIWVASLDYVALTKRYTGRAKDVEDLALIAQHQASNPSL